MKTKDKIVDILDKIATNNQGEDEFLEFKASFASTGKILKTMAGMANNVGGFIVFGINDEKNEIEGLDEKNAELFSDMQHNQFPTTITNTFLDQIDWKEYLIEYNNVKIGVLEVIKSENKPVIALKNTAREIREGDIYYRYKTETKKIGVIEMQAIISDIKNKECIKEHKKWVDLFDKISLYGIDNTGVLDFEEKTVYGSNNAFVIDEKLFNSLKKEFDFIKEGEFTEKEGSKALKIIGDVSIVSNNEAKNISYNLSDISDGSSIGTIISISNDEFHKHYPYRFTDLQTQITKGIRGAGKILISMTKKYKELFKKGNQQYCNIFCGHPESKSPPAYQYSRKAYDEIKGEVEKTIKQGETHE